MRGASVIITRVLSIAGLVSWLSACDSSKNGKPDDPPQDTECPQVTTLSNSCLQAEALSLYQAESADFLVERMAALTVACKPNREEFKELLCQYNQNKK
jgi:hypothetical protein